MTADLLLSRADEHRRDQLEAVVEAGKQTFLEVGQALLELRDGRLYRATHGTFDSYLEDRFGFSRSYASRLIGAARTAEAVLPVGNIGTERQARALAGLDPEEQRDTYLRAQEQTGVAQPTATALANARPDKSRRRRPLPDQMKDAAWDLHKMAAKVGRIVADDRFPQNAQALRDRHLDLLDRTIAELQAARDALAGGAR